MTYDPPIPKPQSDTLDELFPRGGRGDERRRVL